MKNDFWSISVTWVLLELVYEALAFLLQKVVSKEEKVRCRLKLVVYVRYKAITNKTKLHETRLGRVLFYP